MCCVVCVVLLFIIKNILSNYILFYFSQLHWIEQSIKNVLDEPDNNGLCFVSDKDIKQCFDDSQVLVLEAPLGANLSVGAIPSSKVRMTM